MTEDQVKLLDEKVTKLLEDAQASEAALITKALNQGLPPDQAAASVRLGLWPGILSAVSLWRQAEAMSGAVDGLGSLLFTSAPGMLREFAQLKEQLTALTEAVVSAADSLTDEYAEDEDEDEDEDEAE